MARTRGGALLALALVGPMGGLAGCAELDASDLVPNVAFADGPAGKPRQSNDSSAVALLTGQRLVRGLDADTSAAPWPTLSTVPPRPSDVPDPIARQKDMDALVTDRTQAAALARTLEAVANSPDQGKVQRATGADPFAKPAAPAPATTPAPADGQAGADPLAGGVPDVPAAPPTIVIAGPQS